LNYTRRGGSATGRYSYPDRCRTKSIQIAAPGQSARLCYFSISGNIMHPPGATLQRVIVFAARVAQRLARWKG